MAMVHVARQALDVARRLLEEGIALQARLGAGRSRFPANGLHWMCGSVLLARGDTTGALAAFDGERDAAGTLYAREFAVAALNSRGWALLEIGNLADAETAFRSSMASHSEQVRPHLGLAHLARRRGDAAAAESTLAEARRSIERVRQGGRTVEASLMSAAEMLASGQSEDAITQLESLLLRSGHGAAGWLIPIEPLFRPLAGSARFDGVLKRLAERAT
jgi:hypothetical protein